MSITQKITDGTLLVNTDNTGGLLDLLPSTTTLAADVTTTAQTTITVVAVAPSTRNGTYILIGTEPMLVISGEGTSVMVVERGPSPATYLTGDTVHIPGKAILHLLNITAVPNAVLFLRKQTTDINYVEVTTATGNFFPGGGTTLILADNASRGTAHLKFPGFGTDLIVLASGSALVGPAGPTGPAGSPTPPGVFTIGAVTAVWVTVSE